MQGSSKFRGLAAGLPPHLPDIENVGYLVPACVHRAIDEEDDLSSINPPSEDPDEGESNEGPNLEDPPPVNPSEDQEGEIREGPNLEDPQPVTPGTNATDLQAPLNKVKLGGADENNTSPSTSSPLTPQPVNKEDVQLVLVPPPTILLLLLSVCLPTCPQ